MNENKKEVLKELSVEDALYIAGLISLPLGLLSAYIIVHFIVPILPAASECLFWKFFGIYCPGCGGTRALIAFMQGDFLLSAWYHPLLMYCVIMYSVFMISHTLEKLRVPFVRGMKFREWIMYGMLVVLVVNCLLKNFLKFGFGIVMQ